MTMLPRMPQVGERWKLKVRASEYSCERCGWVHATSERFTALNGSVIELVTPSRTLQCGNCGRIKPNYEGMCAFIDPLNGARVAVPYVWLEPLEDEIRHWERQP